MKVEEVRQKKILGGIFGGLVVVAVGLVVAIVVVANMREGNRTDKPCDVDISEEEYNEAIETANLEEYQEIHETIDKIITQTRNLSEADVINAYQYYMGETDSTTVKNMLRMDLLIVEMGYDTEMTRGDELIAVAVEIDETERSMNSAGVVMILADNYGKTDVYNNYTNILNEREIAAGYDPNEEGEG